jgi:hypothetical protein
LSRPITSGRKLDIPDPHLHAVLHTIVENQIAEGDAIPVREKARQLMAQGLTRHDALHAIASVLITFTRELVGGEMTDADPNQRYFRALRRLHARKWLRSSPK